MTNEKNDYWDIVEYTVTKLDIRHGDITTHIQTGQIQNFYIEKDFDNDTFPVFLVNIAMNQSTYYHICQNSDDTVFTIVIQSHVNDGTSNKTKRAIFLADKFIPLGLDNIGYTGESLDNKMKRKKVSDTKDETMDMFNQNYTFVLVREDDISCSKKIINKVLTRTNLTDALGYLLTKAGVKRVLMSAMDNNRQYNELVLLPITLIEQLQYISSFYGLYKEGSQIFFDFDRLYILRNSGKCTAFENGEICTVIFKVYGTDNSLNFNSGSYRDNTHETAYIKASSVEIVDGTKTANATVGTNSIIIDSSGGTINATTNNEGSFNVLNTISHNPYIKTETEVRLTELKNMVTVFCDNIDVRLLKPNRQFRIISSESKISTQTNGIYRLKSSVSFFMKKGDSFKSRTNAVLVKS